MVSLRCENDYYLSQKLLLNPKTLQRKFLNRQEIKKLASTELREIALH